MSIEHCLSNQKYTRKVIMKVAIKVITQLTSERMNSNGTQELQS